MNRAFSRVAAGSFLALAVLAGWLALQQTLAGATYRDDTRNVRSAPTGDARGPITSADGVVLAEDRDGTRTYPEGGTYLHLVGFRAGSTSTGLEAARASSLDELDVGSISSWIVELLGGDPGPPELRLTVVDRAQRAASRALDGHTGAVVALDPGTGAVLAYAVSPTADPNDLVDGSRNPAVFLGDSASLDRAAFRLLPPGSTFKVLVAAAAVEAGFGPESLLEDSAELLAPGAGTPIENVSNGTCSGGDEITLRQAVAVSCNTVFGRLALELGGGPVVSIAERAGFNAVLPFELGTAISSIPTASELDADPGALAQTGLGERDVRATPLQMAVIAAALGNGGELMRPYVVDRIVSGDGTALEVTTAESAGRLVDPVVAAQVLAMMEAVVTEGTGRAAAVAGIEVAGKTGTAEGAGGPHSWFIAVAPASAPEIAIAVAIEGDGTGGTTAAPIAADVITAYLRGR